MSTIALDLTTPMHALLTVEKEFLGKDRTWLGSTAEHTMLLHLYSQMKSKLSGIKGLKGKCSPDYMVLNKFLQDEKFDPMFERFDGIGVVSIIDKLIEWMFGPGNITQIQTAEHGAFPGFELPSRGFQMFWVGENYLIKLLTKSEDTLWLYVPRLEQIPPTSALDMVQMAISVMVGKRESIRNTYPTISIPMIDFDLKPDISFLEGIETKDSQEVPWYIRKAMQQFKFRMNEQGARLKVATGLVLERFCAFEQPLIINVPFYGWMTQGDTLLPIGVFYADYDCWKKPEGGLLDM